MKTNIPLYRSFELDIANIIIGYYLVEDGFYMKDGEPDYDRPCTREYIYEQGTNRKCEVAPEYLSIHFPDMLASDSDRLLPNGEKDLRIFASLQEDGRGGDLIKHYLGIGLNEENTKYPAMFFKGATRRYFPFGKSYPVFHKYSEYKVIGIQK